MVGFSFCHIFVHTILKTKYNPHTVKFTLLKIRNSVAVSICVTLHGHQHHLIQDIFSTPEGLLALTCQSPEGPLSAVAKIPKPKRPKEA